MNAGLKRDGRMTAPAARTDNRDGNQEDDNGKPISIPKARFDEAVGRERELAEAYKSRADSAEARTKALEQELKELREKSSPKQREDAADEEIYTLDEIEKAIREKRITQRQGMALLLEQERRQNEKAIEEKLSKELSQFRTSSEAKSLAERYETAVSDLSDPNSESAKRLEGELQFLKDAGHPDTEETRSLALRMAFGPIDALERPGQRVVQKNEETGGRGRGASQDRGDDGEEMPARNREYYERLISKGVYSGWDDPSVKKQLELKGWKAPK